MNDSIFLKPVYSLEIENLLISLKNNCSFCDQELTNHILVNTAAFIAEPLSIIFNKCFEIEIFPISFKKCLITPTFKSGDKKCIGNITGLFLYLFQSVKFLKNVSNPVFFSFLITAHFSLKISLVFYQVNRPMML